MSTFKTTATLVGTEEMIPTISSAICSYFRSEGYSIEEKGSYSGGKEISVTKGGLFKAILGLRTALNITLQPVGDRIDFEAGVGIFGMQIIPAAITLLVAWPVLVTQIWGMVKQSKLDDKALEIAKNAIASYNSSRRGGTYCGRTCPNCGNGITPGTRYCPNCGHHIE